MGIRTFISEHPDTVGASITVYTGSDAVANAEFSDISYAPWAAFQAVGWGADEVVTLYLDRAPDVGPFNFWVYSYGDAMYVSAIDPVDAVGLSLGDHFTAPGLREALLCGLEWSPDEDIAPDWSVAQKLYPGLGQISTGGVNTFHLGYSEVKAQLFSSSSDFSSRMGDFTNLSHQVGAPYPRGLLPDGIYFQPWPYGDSEAHPDLGVMVEPTVKGWVPMARFAEEQNGYSAQVIAPPCPPIPGLTAIVDNPPSGSVPDGGVPWATQHYVLSNIGGPADGISTYGATFYYVETV